MLWVCLFHFVQGSNLPTKCNPAEFLHSVGYSERVYSQWSHAARVRLCLHRERQGFYSRGLVSLSIQPYTIQRIENRTGDLIFETPSPETAAEQAIRPEHAYLLSDILSDNDARQPEFGPANSLTIPGHRVAACRISPVCEKAYVAD